MPKFSLEGLRKRGDPEFDMKELFLLHQRSEVVARCKVQAHESDYALILVIGGEYVRNVRCITESEVWSLATAWKAELLSQRWHPVRRSASTVWHSLHDEWSVSVLSDWNGPYCSHSGYYSGYASRDAVLIGERIDAPTVAIAQIEILRQLAEQTGHFCSDRCTPWTFELRIQPELEPPS